MPKYKKQEGSKGTVLMLPKRESKLGKKGHLLNKASSIMIIQADYKKLTCVYSTLTQLGTDRFIDSLIMVRFIVGKEK